MRFRSIGSHSPSLVTDMEAGNLSYNRWLLFILLIFSVKFLIFVIDPLPRFFLGDSASYLSTALRGWIPPDRSFVYGFIIRLIAVSTHSLTSLVAAQVFLSALTSVLLAYILVRFLSVGVSVAFLVGFLCSVEPLQLLYERYVMTESFSIFLFAVYIVLIFYYLEKSSLIYLALFQIVGVGLISLRLSFLPIVILNSVIIPLLVIPTLYRKYFANHERFSIRLLDLKGGRPLLGLVALHLVISIGLTTACHLSYMDLNGSLSQRSPAYQYEGGFFLLADWSPVVKPVDFPRKDLVSVVFGALKYDLTSSGRGIQRWWKGGLISNIRSAVRDPLAADRIARETALNILKRDPVGLASLFLSNFGAYWKLDSLKKSMETDEGYGRNLPDDMLVSLQTNFNIAADRLPYLGSFTRHYFFSAWPWYLFLLCLPLFAFILIVIGAQEKKKYFVVVFLSSLILVAIACSLIERPTVRYLHAVGWLSFLVIGPLIDRLRLKRS